MSGITDLLARELRQFDYEPKLTAKASKGWQRCECPFCGYDRAQLNESRGMFWCPKASCARRLTTAQQWSIISQYWDIINKVLYSAAVRKYGQWLTVERTATRAVSEGREFCQERLTEFAASGELDNWELACDGDPDKLRGFVYTALQRDLLDYAKAKVARLRRQRAEGSQTEEPSPVGDLIYGMEKTAEVAEFRRTGSVPDGQYKHLWTDPETTEDDYPTLTLWKGGDNAEGLSVDDIAAKLGVSVRTVKRRIAKETAAFLASAEAKRLLK